jgi:hypothetical protein
MLKVIVVIRHTSLCSVLLLTHFALTCLGKWLYVYCSKYFLSCNHQVGFAVTFHPRALQYTAQIATDLPANLN